MTEFEKVMNEKIISDNSDGFHAPATAPVLLSIVGVFGNRLFEQSEFSIDAHDAEQHRK